METPAGIGYLASTLINHINSKERYFIFYWPKFSDFPGARDISPLFTYGVFKNESMEKAQHKKAESKKVGPILIM